MSIKYKIQRTYNLFYQNKVTWVDTGDVFNTSNDAIQALKLYQNTCPGIKFRIMEITE